MGDSQHTQNIQINEVIGGNEKCVFYFMEKKLSGLFGQPSTSVLFPFCFCYLEYPSFSISTMIKTSLVILCQLLLVYKMKDVLY